MSDDERDNMCGDCGGYMSTANFFNPRPPKPRRRRDDPFSGLVTMGVIAVIPRCAHCEWDNRLLPGTPAEAGLHSLRRLFHKGLIDNAEFLARERAMLLELLEIDSLEVVPGTIKSEIAAHIASRRAEVPDPDEDWDWEDAVPFLRSFPPAVTMDQLIEGYDVDTGIATVHVDIRRIINLVGADAPGPHTAMWIRLTEMNEAAERTKRFAIDPADILNQAFGEALDKAADDDD